MDQQNRERLTFMYASSSTIRGSIRGVVAARHDRHGAEEAGDELFTFTAFPSSQWKALRTTNALERINEEFRRRTKTQASLPSEEAVLFLLFVLLRSGQVRLRRLVGWGSD